MPIMSKVPFMETDMMLDEACRQWYAFIKEDESRADGIGFGRFFRQLSDEMYEEYRRNPDDFDFQKSHYPLFLSLNEEEAEQLSVLLADKSQNTDDRLLESIKDKLSEHMNSYEERMVQTL